MPTSAFDDLMTGRFIPAFNRVFGIDALHTNNDGDEATVKISLEKALDSGGLDNPWPQRQLILQTAKDVNPQPGEIFTVAGTVTDDDPYPNDLVYRVDSITDDDGYLVTCTVRLS